MRVPRIIKRFLEPGEEDIDVEIEEDEMVEDDEFWDIGQEIEERNVEVEVEEATYSGVLMSEAGQAKEPAIEKKEYTLPEFRLSPEEKKAAEADAFGDTEERIIEKNWEKTAPESLEEIEQHIDEGRLEREEAGEPEKAERAPCEKAVTPPETGGADIPGTVIAREIVYKTDGGYVLKVTAREDGDVETSYYSVSRVDGIEQALDKIQDYRPTVKESSRPAARKTHQPSQPEQTEQTEQDSGGEKKSFFGSVLGKK